MTPIPRITLPPPSIKSFQPPASLSLTSPSPKAMGITPSNSLSLFGRRAPRRSPWPMLSSLPRGLVTVAYFTTNATASAGTDYEGQSGTLSFGPGTLTQTIHIPVAGNTADEGQEVFFVQLVNPQNATLARGRGVVTITD